MRNMLFVKLKAKAQLYIVKSELRLNVRLVAAWHNPFDIRGYQGSLYNKI
jgi:hypothetical protein